MHIPSIVAGHAPARKAAHRRPFCQGALAAGLLLGVWTCSQAQAGAVLYVDLVVGEQSKPQPGFVGCKVDPNPKTKVPVTYEVTSAFNQQKYTLLLTDASEKNGQGDFYKGRLFVMGRSRIEANIVNSADGQGFTYADIYRDLIATNNIPLLAIEIKGLEPHTPYQVTFYCYDAKQSAMDGRTLRFSDFNAPDEQVFGPDEGMMFVGQDGHLTNSKYMVSAISRPSDAQGRLFFVERASNGAAVLNAILIDDAPRHKLPVETAEAPAAVDPVDIGNTVIQPQQVSTVP